MFVHHGPSKSLTFYSGTRLRFDGGAGKAGPEAIRPDQILFSAGPPYGRWVGRPYWESRNARVLGEVGHLTGTPGYNVYYMASTGSLFCPFGTPIFVVTS